jgi:hypothetical protein
MEDTNAMDPEIKQALGVSHNNGAPSIVREYSIRKVNSVAYSTSDSQKCHRQHRDKLVVGMACVLTGSTHSGLGQESVEEAEKKVRESVATNPFYLAMTGNYASIKVFVLYLITIDTLFSCVATVLLTLFWYYQKVNEQPSYCKTAILRSH